MKITMVKIVDIVVPEQHKTYSQETVDLLVKSIKECGLVNPIHIDRTNVLIAGFFRMKACQQIGMTEIPAYVFPEGYKDKTNTITLEG